MKEKRVTIHDIARQAGIAPSSVSKALNDSPSISEKVRNLVKTIAKELNYKHNLTAANLRKGSSRTIGVIVPKINVAFFADIIAGIEEKCFENNHRLIICQSDESFAKEVQAVDTLIRQNVDCMLISLSQQTQSNDHLREITNHHIHLIQFDRVDHQFASHTVVNDNRQTACKAVRHLVQQGYKRIAFLGGPGQLALYKERKEGYLAGIGEANLTHPYTYVADNVLNTQTAFHKAIELFEHKKRPDAFCTVSDYAALGVLKAAMASGLKVPQDVGIVGFSNEVFSEVTSPTLSTVDQQSKMIGKEAADLYFESILKENTPSFLHRVVNSNLVIRQSSGRKTGAKRSKPPAATI